MKISKKLTAIAVVAATTLALGLAGCSGGSNASSASSAAAEGDDTVITVGASLRPMLRY